MLFATVRKSHVIPGTGEVVPAQTILCVSTICVLASAPLLVALVLMIWGG